MNYQKEISCRSCALGSILNIVHVVGQILDTVDGTGGILNRQEGSQVGRVG